MRLVVVVHLAWLSSHWWLHHGILLLIHHVCGSSLDELLLHLSCHCLDHRVSIAKLLLNDLLVWLHHSWHHHRLEHVDVVRVVEVVKDDIHVLLDDALLVQEVSNCVHVTTHLLCLLQEFFSLIKEVHWDDLLLPSLSH